MPRPPADATSVSDEALRGACPDTKASGALSPGLQFAPAGRATLVPDFVDLWVADLSRLGGAFAMFLKSLSARERAVAARFNTDVLRRRYILSHGAARLVLARYLERRPADLVFARGRHGKPHLQAPPTELAFNLSHSGNLALIGVGSGLSIGVDVEVLRHLRELDRLAQSALAPDERRALGDVPPDARARRFLELWTLKEAMLKACGEGLERSLDGFSVGLGACGRATLRRTERAEERDWSLHSFTPTQGYCAAAVATRPDIGWRVRSLTIDGRNESDDATRICVDDPFSAD